MGASHGIDATDALIPREIAEIPAAIEETLRAVEGPARSAANLMRAKGVGRLYFIGNGTSYHSCLAAAWLSRRHAAPTDPVVIPVTAAEMRYYSPALASTDAIVAISASGEFRDVLAVVEELRGKATTIGIVHVPGSSLTRLADFVLVAGGGPSDVPVMTKTFASTLTAAYALVSELLGLSMAATVRAEIHLAAQHARRAVADARGLVPHLADALAASERVFVVGGGGAHVAAMEAALKLKEIALVHAEAAETWEMESGGATILGPGTVVIGLAPSGRAREATGQILRHAASWGARIVEVGPERHVAGSDLLPLQANASEDLACLTTVPPVALLAFELACRRGIDADHPAWTERYALQGLHHVIGAAADGAPR